MKTPKEIERLAKARYSYDYGEDISVTDIRRNSFEEGYIQCQKDNEVILKKMSHYISLKMKRG